MCAYPFVYVLGGPTASGKSNLAHSLAKALGAVIINADSMQVYKEIPILTAQPEQHMQEEADYRLYGFLQANKSTSAAKWAERAAREIRDAWRNKKLPIVVGGTGMYLKVLMEGIAPIPDISPEIRKRAEERREDIGIEEFFKELQKIDPESGKKLNPGDKQRVLRAWEVSKQTGNSISFWQNKPRKEFIPEAKFITQALIPERKALYENCENRFEEMIDKGAITEVEQLIDKHGSDEALPALKALGVPELAKYIKGELSFKDTTELAKQSTRRFAKRQYTWFCNQWNDEDLIYNSRQKEVHNVILQNLEEKLNI